MSSTQTVAKGLAAMGAKEGTTVVAKSQSSGLGRMGRSWISPEGGLYMSFVLRPGAIRRPELVTLVAALAVTEGIKRATSLAPTIRWPNDVMLNGKKLAGVNAEAQSFRGEVTQMVVGIGVDCNTPAPELKPLEGEATSIAQELGRRVEISEVKHAILDAFSFLYEQWKQGRDLSGIWREKVATIGNLVLVKLKTEEDPFSGVAREVDRDGNLSVARGGETETVRPEDLEWLREQT